MIGFSDFLNADPTDWLLEEENPSVRYLTLRTIVEMPEDHRAVQQARREIMERGPVPAILQAQHPEGYWLKPGAGYSPKYRATIWQIKFLAQLAADGSDPRVAKGCEYVLGHSRARNGAFSITGVPSAAIDCLNGNLIHAFISLGYGRDERVQEAVHQLCASISEKHFQCAANAKLPCGWGAVKALLAFTAIPPEERNSEVKAAIEEGADFLLSRNPAVADYPCWERVSSTWQKFGFPLSYSSNVLEALWVLAELGHGNSPVLGDALKLVLSKQDAHGRWKMESSLNGKMWADIEAKGKPSKWVTLQAMQMLKRVYGGY
ncbi:MAG: nitrogen fixation protein NifH [Dehalococcoidia bacterium]|nr:nitrogen fixation protein NifH [Dehalococcoidia bacterium]